MRQSKNKAPKITPTFAVVVDGETEVWYLQMLKRNEKNIRVSIKPEIPNKKSLKEQYDSVCDLSKKDFTKVFWIVDLDTIIKETNEAVKSKKTPIQTFAEYRAKLKKMYKDNVIVIVNNPCLEFWFLLHFEKTTRYFNACSGAESQLKTHTEMQNYAKTRGFFTRQGDDIYLKLKPKLKDALKNATLLGTFDCQNPTNAMCEMQLLFDDKEIKSYLE